MLVKLVEIYRKSKEHTTLNEVTNGRNVFLRQVYINPDHVVLMREDSVFGSLGDTMLLEEIDSRQEFTRLRISQGSSSTDIVVVGSLSSVGEKLLSTKKQLLRG